MKVYIGSNLRKDKNPTSYVPQCIMICWVETPLYPSFYRLRGRVYKKDPSQLLLYLIGTLSLLASFTILIYDYLYTS
jgi:hypothetical protein